MSGVPRPPEVPVRAALLVAETLAREWVTFFRDLISRTPQYEEIHLEAAGIVYFGDEETDGSWRMMRSGTGFVHQRREAGTWTTKDTIVA